MALIDQQTAIDAVNIADDKGQILTVLDVLDVLKALPTVQPTIIHCKDCKHWNLQVGNVKGDGLGSCDFHNVNFVTGEGFCYWAERKDEDGTD